MAVSYRSSSKLLRAVLGLFVIVVIEGAQGLSSFVVTSGRPKCFKMEIPGETTVRIHYESPDVDTDKNRKNYAPTYITLAEKTAENIFDMVNRRPGANGIKPPPFQNRERRMKQKPVSHEITETSGSFVHRMHEEDADVEVCVRCSNASAMNPVFIHLRVEEVEEDIKDAFEQENIKRPPLLNVDHHWSFLEAQLDRIEHEMHGIIREAGFFRERDAVYHQKMDSLNKATVFWPMLQCFIIVVTGFTQANHIIAFFKKRRII